MAEGTDLNNKSGATDVGNIADNNKKFEFDADEQVFINGIIDKSVGKVHGQYKPQIDALTKEIDALKAAATAAATNTNNKGADVDGEAKDKQMKELLDTEKAKTKHAELLAKQRETELASAKEESMRIRKEVAIQRAAAKQNFYELDVVMRMTSDDIQWDDETKNFVVKENGIVKQNSSLQPMTLEEYFSSFAAQRPYLVNGDMVGGGSGSTESKTSLNAGLVKTKADLKSVKEKSDFITKFGLAKYEELPLK